MYIVYVYVCTHTYTHAHTHTHTRIIYSLDAAISSGLHILPASRFEQYSAISSGLECAEQGTADLDASTSVANKANSTSAWQAVANLTARDTEAAGMYVKNGELTKLCLCGCVHTFVAKALLVLSSLVLSSF